MIGFRRALAGMSVVLPVMLAAAGLATGASAQAQDATATTPAAPSASAPRNTIALASGWRFHFGDADEAPAAPGFDDSGWEAVSVPHTWNRLGNYGATRQADFDNRQGIGWYRLAVAAPALAKGQRAYLDFGAVSKIADVWVNGVHLGQHRGAFARFRFDVTAVWKPGQANVIAVRADNSKPAPGNASGETIPLAGDFFVYGGLYRPVSLIIAPEAGIDLLDFGGPGVYAHASAITATLRDADGREVARASQKLQLAAGTAETPTSLTLPHPHLWNGTADPYLYTVTVELAERGRVTDSVTQPLGIRSFRFDANEGTFLNGQHVQMHGVSRHQAKAGEGWALTPADAAEDMAMIRDMGANTVRMAHYQHADEWVGEADHAGMMVWEEVPYVAASSLTGGVGSPALWANAELQLKEMIRQQFNHPSIAMWSVGNEVDSARGFGIGGKEPLKPLALLQHLNAVAHTEDPTRATTFADCCEEMGMIQTAGELLAGTADLIGYNRYYGWYYPQPEKAAAQFAAQLDHLHAKHPALPLSISEYGGGGAISQHSDNVAAGFLNFTGRPQPEEFESYVHEANWPVIAARKYVFASWVWTMFDFPSNLREEGDSFDLNSKGLVTFDRKVKKDAFYYYKAQWSDQPVLWLTSKRYVDRAYPVIEVKAYSNAGRASLSLNGVSLGEVACGQGICRWPQVALRPGANRAVVSATVAGKAITDEALWNGPDTAQGIRIDVGDLAGRETAGHRFGSDNFVTGGQPMALNLGGFGNQRPKPRKVDAPNPELYEYWREGEAFSYAIPVPNGTWQVIIHSFEPHSVAPATQTMAVSANGKQVIAPFSVMQAAGGALKGITRSFPAIVRNGVLTLDFTGQSAAGEKGRAVVAAIEIVPQGTGPSVSPQP